MTRSDVHILLVDDNTSSLEVLCEVLTRANYNVTPAASGQDALTVVRGSALDLAILDFDLPDTTGIELLQQIRQFCPGLPVILMSANVSPGLQLDAFEAGAYTFMRKPLNLQQLLRFVGRALEFGQQWAGSRMAKKGEEATITKQTVQVKQSIFVKWIRIIRQK